jgi:hypothetical protein
MQGKAKRARINLWVEEIKNKLYTIYPKGLVIGVHHMLDLIAKIREGLQGEAQVDFDSLVGHTADTPFEVASTNSLQKTSPCAKLAYEQLLQELLSQSPRFAN